MSKYGFGGGLDLPETTPEKNPKPQVERMALDQAVQAGNAMGFVSREPAQRAKPGPKRREAQDKMSIPGPKRVIDDFRRFCREQDLTLWQGIELLLEAQRGRGGQDNPQR